MSVVPDSITPVEGWKMFRFENGILRSPAYPLTWNPGKPAQAACVMDMYKLEWVPTSTPPPPVPEETPSPLVSAVTTTPYSSIPPKPRILLPRGKYWTLQMSKVTHDAPGHECGCGIYIAKTPDIAANYGTILGKVKGWGTTIEHSQGWRVEYAYPSELIAFSIEQALDLAAYGVPVTLIEDVDDPLVAAVALAGQQPSYPSPSKTLRTFLAVAPLFLAALMIGQGVNVAFNPSVIGLVAFGVAAFATGLLLGERLASR